MAKAKTGRKGGATALEQSPSHLLHRALQVALDIYAEEFGPGAVTQRQYALLAACAEHEGATQTDLVRITGIDRSTLADMAGRMIVKGLLERERSASDARANAVSLTAAGREALEEARPRMAQADQRLLKRLSGGGRRDTFVKLLKDMISEPAEPEAKAPKSAKAKKADKAEGKKKKPKKIAA